MADKEPKSVHPHSPKEEETLNSRGYHLIRKIGEGTYATVYLTEYTPPEQEKPISLACKIVNMQETPKMFAFKFFPRELEILVSLNHPHIIHIHSIFRRRTKFFIFMRYAEHGDLLDFIQDNGALMETQARVWFRQIGLAVQYLHEREIAHRDLKCENILITTNFNVKVADFGFSRFVLDCNGNKVLSTTYCGSLSYVAPEILRGLPYNPKVADLWSMGVILYVMLNQSMPFDDTNTRKLFNDQVSHKWKFRSKISSQISDEVKMLTTSLLKADVIERCTLTQLITSDWIAMDLRLTTMTNDEMLTLSVAQEQGRHLREAKMMTTPIVTKTSNESISVDEIKLPKKKSAHSFTSSTGRAREN